MFKKFTLIMAFMAGMAAAICIPISSLAASVDGKPAFSTEQDSGVYVWRAPATGVWQVRVLAGNYSHNFDGVLESSGAFSDVNGISLESDDVASETQPGTLDLQFHLNQSGLDGLAFTLSGKDGLCLRQLSESVLPVYLGEYAQPATDPVDLTDSGACGGTSAQTTTVIADTNLSVTGTAPVTATVATPGQRKYHPGHYLALYGYETQSAMYDGAHPGVRGINKRYTWHSLEPALGQYDFSQIKSDLAVAASQGLQLVVMVEDKSFKWDPKPTPEYLWGEQYTQPTRIGGYTAVRYNPYVIKRFKALLAALGRRFDSDPNLEGIALQETALGFVDSTLDATGYTPEKYRDALIEIVLSAADSFPTSQVFWYMNFLSRKQAYLADVAAAVAPAGVQMGGPDILPDDDALQKHVYPLYDQFQGKMPLFCSAQNDSYKHEHADTSYPTLYWTTKEIFEYARDRLGAGYVFWNHNKWGWSKALPVIEANPVFNQ